MSVHQTDQEITKMPKKPIKRKVQKDLLTTEVLEQILTGHVFFADPLDDADLKRIYKKNRKYIMSLIGANVKELWPDIWCRGIPVPYGSRPAAWWAFESPEPRKLIEGDQSAILPGKGHLGIPRFRTTLEAYYSMKFESQFAYLKRLGLLREGEAEKYDPDLLRPW
jgi:hypothetical protein